MNLIPHKISKEHTVEPLHQLLLSFGKNLWQRPLLKPQSPADDVQLVQQADDRVLQARVKELTIKQVATTLRMQEEDSENLAMIGSLESLVMAGEITFADYIGRLQNLFPKSMAGLDVPLRMKIASFML